MDIKGMEGKDKIVLMIAIFFFVVYLLSFPRYFDTYPVFTSPGENSEYFFSKLYQNTGNLKMETPLYGYLPNNITVAFTPRDTAQFQGYIVPHGFLGMLLTFGILSVFHENGILLFMPIFGVFTAITVYLIARNIFSKQVAFVAFILTLLFPPFWLLSSTLIKDDIPSTFSFLLGIYYLIKFISGNQKTNLLLSCLFIITSMYFRLVIVLLLIPVFFLILYYFYKDHSKYIYIVFVTGLMTLTPLLLLNNELYGHFLKTGYDITKEFIMQETINFEDDIPVFELYSLYITQYLSAFSVILMCSFFSIIRLIHHNNKIKRYMVFYTLFVFLVAFIYYGQGIMWGTAAFSINSSFLRYMIPVFVLLNILFAFFISKLKFPLRSFIVVFFIVSSINTVILSNGGIIEKYESIQYSKAYREFVLSNMEPKSFFVTQYNDKIIFPHSYIITVPYLSENKQPVNLGLYRPVTYTPPQNIYNEKLLEVAKIGAPVYIDGNQPYIKKYSLESLKEYLQKNNHTLKRIEKDSFVIYKITKI